MRHSIRFPTVTASSGLLQVTRRCLRRLPHPLCQVCGHASHSASHRLTDTTAAAIELLVKRVWYRSRARIQGTRSGGAPAGTCTTPPSPAMRLPQEIVEIIIGHLTRDFPALRSCSLTCYSWYIAAVPHLHATLQVFLNLCWGQKWMWPTPILHMYRLGLLPLIKSIRIWDSYDQMFSSKRLNCFIRRQFQTLSNVETLEIQNLDISSLMPRIQRYFRSFLPTLRSLHLISPKGSNRQIIFFIGLFQHLENLSLKRGRPVRRDPEDLTLIPSSVPPLQGRLVAWRWERVLFQDMIRLFGRISFTDMYLYNVCETRLLLHACADTLQVLRLDPDDPLGEQPYPRYPRF